MVNSRRPVSSTASLAERLAHAGWTQVVRVSELGPCWEWGGNRTPKGYGQCSVGHRRTRGAHRVSYEVNIGPLVPGMVVCHRCDNPPCINPAHLFQGTHSDNFRDMQAKGRQNYASGQRHGIAKLTDEQVHAIRELAAGGIRYGELALLYGVTSSNIGKIVRGRSRAA